MSSSPPTPPTGPYGPVLDYGLRGPNEKSAAALAKRTFKLRVLGGFCLFCVPLPIAFWLGMVVFSSGTAIVALLVGAIAGSFFVSLAMNGRAWLIGWLSGFVTVLALSGMFEYVTWRL